jgi:hypothetical protein
VAIATMVSSVENMRAPALPGGYFFGARVAMMTFFTAPSP